MQIYSRRFLQVGVVLPIVVAVLSRLALPQTYVLEKKAVVLKDGAGNTVTSIPIDAPWSTNIAFSKASNTFYVLNAEGKSTDRFLSAVNLTTHRVDRVIKVGAVQHGKWSTVELLMSNDGHRLFCYTLSNPITLLEVPTSFLPSPSMPSFARGLHRNLKPPFEPVVTVIDTTSNDVIATYEWFDSVRAAMPKSELFDNRFFTTNDGGHLIALFRGFKSRTLHQEGQQLAIFSGQSPHPTVAIDPGGTVVAMMLSQNERSLFVAVEKSGQPSGSLDIVDLETGSTTNRALTNHPTKLIRLGSQQGMWVLSGQEMRSVSETGELGDHPILLNKPRKAEEGDKSSADVFLNGYPGETINLSEGHAAILITDKNGASLHRVALIDLTRLQVDSIVVTMSAAEQRKIRSGRIAASLVSLMLLPPSMAYMAAPNLRLKNEALAARPDGRFLYVLDTDTHEVTVIDVQTATVVVRIPVDKSVTKLQVSSDGKYLSCMYIGKEVQKINLESNKMEN